ncbi:MAG: Coenzyme F420 hydrogenase/dehydrogenase, beta subunit C-terminal domain [Clostridia bacterium]|nr:Coenzyme F420 hydrogenase/dehydrogenase, beta subunit C-terminal domain [Clostridia bacterium]
MKYIVDRPLCSGCGACENICPVGAIKMEYDKEGFIYPVVSDDKCIDCGACGRVCPVNSMEKTEPRDYLKTYAGYSEDEATISGCTSGGFATALSEIIINDGGVVYGVKYADDFIKSEYTRVESKDGLLSLMGSKYVQSEKRDIFKSVKSDLAEGRLTLFVGCPCDVMALKAFLGREYDNLYTVELVCMGVTSYKIAEEYKKYTEKKNRAGLVYINARSKKCGWFVPTLEERFDNGRVKTQTLYASYLGYGSQVYNRPSCFKCKFRDRSGVADFRVGDFWGIKEQDEFWNKRGVCCIFVRSERGLSMLERLTECGFKLFETDYKSATESNMSSLYNKSEKYVELRERFARVFLEKGLVAACRSTASTTFKLKRIIPRGMQSTLKKIYHKFVDKR